MKGYQDRLGAAWRRLEIIEGYQASLEAAREDITKLREGKVRRGTDSLFVAGSSGHLSNLMASSTFK